MGARGFDAAVTAPTDVQPSTILNIIGMGWDAADANIQIMHNDGSVLQKRTEGMVFMT